MALDWDTIHELAAEYEDEPFYIVSKEKLVSNFQRIDDLLPAVKVYYAVKTNPQEDILRTLHEAGAGFDVASRLEILAALEAGANPVEDLIFANTIKKKSDIEYAHSIGIDDLTFDNSSELAKIAEYAPGTQVIVRIKVPNHGSVAHLSEKFGAEPEDALDLLLQARDLRLVPKGVSFHVGSECLDAQRWVDALELTADIFEQAENEGMTLQEVDIGGGLPVKYTDEEFDIEEMCNTITGTYGCLFDKDVKLTTEPGRAIVGDAVWLVTRIIGKAERDGRTWLYLNDGTYGSFMETLLYEQEWTFLTEKEGALEEYVLAGPTCDSIDVITYGAQLPHLEVGDLIVVPSAGAYTYSESTRFNGFPPAAFELLESFSG